MRAGWYERNGPAREVLRLGEMPAVEPGPGEVRVRLHASGINPSDVKGRAGLTRKIAFPRVIPQSDGAGVIEAVGAGVPAARLGQKVWTFNAQWQRPFGTAAETVTLPASTAPPLPAGLDYAAGACLGIPVMTAHRCLFADGPVDGLNVLVTGGAGVVGHYAVQLAKWGGAKTVIATVSSEAKAQAAREAGADHVINYRSEDVGERALALTAGAGVDRIVDVDFGANLAASQQAIRNGGAIGLYASTGVPEPALPVYPFMFKNVTVRFVLVYNMSDAAKAQAVADIDKWASGGRARFLIARHFALERLVEAHEFVEAGDRKIGHVVLDIP
ncbi:MAG: NADPH:quinone reductase [Alphaproteobacteria bacterium]|nr:NADPH:quinone reductase [Alphaproteobacteria bacterium]